MLTSPTVADLVQFRNEDVDAADEHWVEYVLGQSALFIRLVTGLTDYPTDADQAQLVRNAIMDLTTWLLVHSENRTEEYSPFSSEHIGSYSYAKQQIANAVRAGQPTGVMWLDMLLDAYGAFARLADSDDGWGLVSSQNVMPCSPEPFRFSRHPYIPDFYGR